MKNPFRQTNIEDMDGKTTESGSTALDIEESFLDKEMGEFLHRELEGKMKFRILSVLTIISVSIIFARLYYLTFEQHEYYRGIAEGNRLRVEYISAPRGGIYDKLGSIMATNKPSFELAANLIDLPKDQDERLRQVATVSEIINMSIDDINASLNHEYVGANQSVLVKQSLSRDEALILLERSSHLQGFYVSEVPIREYKYPFVNSHIVGYVGKLTLEEYRERAEDGYMYNDQIGKTGLEQVYESYLRGTFGQRQIEIDSRGSVKRIFGEVPSKPGQNLFLNVDQQLQDKLHEILVKRVQAIGRKAAVAIALNPNDGRILAFISLPSYDNNLFAEGVSFARYAQLQADQSRPLFNRAIAGSYPPGSTVKPMVAAAALQEGVVGENTTVVDKGNIVIENIYGGPDSIFYGYARGGLGKVDVRKAIALSSDIFFYIVGGGYDPEKISGLGISKIAEYFRKFHLGVQLGIDLPGEVDGLVPTPEWKKEYFAGDAAAERWYLGDTYHVAIGQGDLLTTPLQVLSMTASIANGGRIFKPFIVDRVEDQDGNILQKNEPQLLAELGIDQKNIEIAREGMRQVVTEGTAKSLQQLPITSAGKTGTAQFDAKNLSRTHAWFTAFAPYEDPEIAIVVLIEDGGEGGTNSVPVVRETLDWWARERYLKK